MKKYFKLFILILLIGIIFNADFVLVASADINNEVKALNQEIAKQKDRLKELQNKEKEYSEAIKQAQSEQASLQNQIYILENRIAKAKAEIESTELKIDQINLEIKKNNLEIKKLNEKIEKEKEHIANILKVIYQQGESSTLEILLLNNSFSDFINQMKYLEDINKEISVSIESLKGNKRQLEKEKEELNQKNQDLVFLLDELEKNKEALTSEINSKDYLLAQTKDSESRYQNLLSKAKAEQAQASADISSLEKAVRDKIAGIEGQELKFNDNGLIWPVPKNTITAYFHDPNYPYRYIFEHPAIDIKAAQGTPLKAAASGYVARVKIDGPSYGYIMIVHGDGLATVYGHASKSFVSEDEYVVQGQVIGLSGGMPGTTGAGYLTTGPHLHFEVRLNGIPVDPLEYLP